MATEIPIPFTGESVDTDDDPSKIVMTVVAVIGGFALLTLAQRAGVTTYNRANNMVSQLTGYQLNGSQDSGPGGV